MYLVEVDDGLPEGVGQLVEVTHTNLTEVTGVVLFRNQCQRFQSLSSVRHQIVHNVAGSR